MASVDLSGGTYQAQKNASGQFVTPDNVVITGQTGANAWSDAQGRSWSLGADGQPKLDTPAAPKPVTPTAPAPGAGAPVPYGNDTWLNGMPSPTLQRSTNPGIGQSLPLPPPTLTSTNPGIVGTSGVGTRSVTSGPSFTPTPINIVPNPPTTGAPNQPTPTSGSNDPIAIIRQYQSSHPASGGATLDEMVAQLRAAGINASRFMYGNIPSNNELDIPGYGKYKVFSEGNNSWYYGGAESGAPSGPSGPTATTNTSAPTGPMSYQQALAYIQGKLGRQLSQSDITGAFAKFGGSPSDTFYAQNLDPVVAYFAGGGGLTPPPGGAGPYPGGGGGLPTTPYGPSTFTDPATAYYEQLLKLYSQKLLEPVNNPAQQQLYDLLQQAIAKYSGAIGPYEDAAQKRMTELQGPLYSDQQYDTLRTGMFDDLEHQRQQALQNVTETMASHGHGQSSGTLAEALKQTNNYFDQLRAQKQNGFDQQLIGMQEDRRNQVVDLAGQITGAQEGRIGQQLGLSGNLSGLVAGDQELQLSRDAQAVSTGAALAELPERRLQLALQTYGVGSGPSSSLGQTAIQLQQQLTNQQLIAQQQRNSFAQGMGNYIGYLINSGVFSSGARGAASSTPSASYQPNMTNGFG